MCAPCRRRLLGASEAAGVESQPGGSTEDAQAIYAAAQEALIWEQAERVHQEEINQLKTDLVTLAPNGLQPNGW